MTIAPWYIRWLFVLALAGAAMGGGAGLYHKYIDGPRYERLSHDFTVFQTQVADVGRVAKAAADAKTARQTEETNALRANLALANSNYDRTARELLKRPPTRPDGSTVPTSICVPQGAAGSAGTESVSLSEYRVLEARALADVQTLNLYQAAIDGMAAAGAIVVR